MKAFLKVGITFILVIAMITILAMTTLAAPCNGEVFRFKQPDNTYVSAKVYGDEYYQRVEGIDGYTLCYDSAGWICYAVLSSDGTKFVSSGTVYRGLPQKATVKSNQGKTIPKGLKLNRTQIIKEVNKKRLKLNPMSNTTPKAVSATALTGTVRGLAILIDFPDETSSIGQTQISNMLNQTGYNEYGNNGSVKDYFYSVSGGQLTYINQVTEFYTAKKPKTYYIQGSDYSRAFELIKEALDGLEAKGFNFSTLSTDSNKTVMAINCYYAGERDSPWGSGLWPHQGWVWPTRTYDGVKIGKYQMCNIGSGLSIGTTVHENGHMLGGWEDLYDYEFDSKGCGGYCVMSSTDPYNPVPPCPYFRQKSGWVGYYRLNDSPAGAQNVITAGSLIPFRWDGPNTNEYFMLENIRKTGRWENMPDEGLIVWHIDTKGDHNAQQMTSSKHFLVSVEQADGQYHLESNSNYGDSDDLFHAGWVTRFNNSTTPNSNWWDGSASGMNLNTISTVGNEMTFTVGNDTGDTGDNTIVNPDVNPLIWYTFNQSSGETVVDSVSSQNANLVNGPTWVSGKSDIAVNLDGIDDYVNMPAGIISSLNDFTISTWVRFDTLADWMTIFYFSNGADYMYLAPQTTDGGGMCFGIAVKGSGSEQQIYYTEKPATGSWQHVALTKSGSVAILYLNGVEVGRNNDMTTNPSSLGNTTANYIGCSEFQNAPYLSGQVDEFRIYNRALSKDEIYNQYVSEN